VDGHETPADRDARRQKAEDEDSKEKSGRRKKTHKSEAHPYRHKSRHKRGGKTRERKADKETDNHKILYICKKKTWKSFHNQGIFINDNGLAGQSKQEKTQKKYEIG